MVDSSPQGAPIDRYVVLKYLAEGGMGAIYLGKKLGAGGFEKQVVLKQLLPEFTRQPEFIDLFLREARLSATLDHANIIHTIDLVTAGEEYFIVMEYLAGADLRSLLKRAKRSRHRRLSAAAGIYIACELLSALQYAHNKIGPHGKPLRLIHRDVSPSNILVSHNGEVKLTDFGIAKASTHNSVFYRVKGKVGYMSPEQAHNEPLDSRSDLYSLAVCIYEVITGERLFVQAGLTTSAEDLYNQPIELVSRKVPGLPAELDKVMLRALSRERDHRYQTASEFQEALLRCAHRAGLMMSAPELADHLGEVCGPHQNWREIEARAESRGGGRGTELYEDFDGTEQIDVGDDYDYAEADDLISVVHPSAAAPIFSDKVQRRVRAKTSITSLARLKNLELTSMINVSDLDSSAGAEPLVDLDDLAQAPDIAADLAAPDFEDDDRIDRALDRSYREAEDPSGPFAMPTEVVTAEPERRRGPWLIIAVILLAGIGVAAAIGFTGPKLDSTNDDPAPSAPTTTPPTPPAGPGSGS